VTAVITQYARAQMAESAVQNSMVVISKKVVLYAIGLKVRRSLMRLRTGIVHNGTGQEDVVASNTGRQSAHFILVSKRHGEYNPSNVSQRYDQLLKS
jgi:hypothetical protein